MLRLRPRSRPIAATGFTLIEVLVVLILIGLAAALVLPSLESRPRDRDSELGVLVRAARDRAIRDGAVLRLRVESSGQWWVVRETGGAVVWSGVMRRALPAPFALVFSPGGSCAPPADGHPLEGRTTLDPLLCELRSS